MFKKVEIWIIYLILLLGIVFTIFFGALVRHELLGGKIFKNNGLSWIPETALFLAEIPVNFKRLFRNDNGTEDRFPHLSGFNGTPNSEESYLLLSRYNGDLNEGIVELIDMKNFNILHTWNPDFTKLNDLVEQVDEFEFLSRDNNSNRQTLMHPILTKDGGLLFNSSPLRKINSCSDLVFQNTDDVFHHSIETDIDGNIWVPSRLFPYSLPIEMVGESMVGDDKFKDDAIVQLSPDGKVIYRKSLYQLFIDNGMESRLSMTGTTHTFQHDPIHINDIQPVNYDGKFWKKGDVFLSLGHQNMILLFRPSSEEIVWKYTKGLFHQHDVNIVDENRISIFNNNRRYYHDRDIVKGHNEILIYNFETDKLSTFMPESFSENDIRTISQGRGEILPNREFFVEETDYARTLYFNQDGSLRWTHVNRALDGNVYSVAWSRILYKKEDLEKVKNFLINKSNCNE